MNDKYTIDVDEHELSAIECSGEDCNAVTIGVGYEPTYCANCGVHVEMNVVIQDHE